MSAGGGSGRGKADRGEGGWIVSAGGGGNLSGGIFHVRACGGIERVAGRQVLHGTFSRCFHGGAEAAGNCAATLRVFRAEGCAAGANRAADGARSEYGYGDCGVPDRARVGRAGDEFAECVFGGGRPHGGDRVASGVARGGEGDCGGGGRRGRGGTGGGGRG